MYLVSTNHHWSIYHLRLYRSSRLYKSEKWTSLNPSIERGEEMVIYAGMSVSSNLAADGNDGVSLVNGGSWSMIAFMPRMRRYWKIATTVGRKQNMMTKMATIGDFTAIANSTDVTAKIPTAGMACKIPKTSVPSCWVLDDVRERSTWDTSHEKRLR